MQNINMIKQQIADSISVKNEILNNENTIKEIYRIREIIINTLKNEKKIILFGNGGSCSDAFHIKG